MFALSGIQPQIAQYVPVSQLTSLLSHARTTACSVIGRHYQKPAPTIQDHQMAAPAQETSPVSEEITENMYGTIQELELEKLAGVAVDVLRSAALPRVTTTGDRHNHWRPSHVSACTFWENKHGFTEQQLFQKPFSWSQIINPSCVSETRWLPLSLVQTRGFKTRRSSRGSLGLGKSKLEEDRGYSALKFFRESVVDRVSGRQPKQTDRIKSLLEGQQVTPEIQEKIKIAFAEGYAANDKRETEQFAVWPRRIARFILYGLILWLGLQVLQGYSAIGGNMKINVLKGERYEVNPEDITVTFDDVMGVDEAKQELKDVVEFLRDAEKFQSLGAKLPKGVLLVGPPGIGKTLLARAVAGEAGVPFFHASGSEFDEIFVGTGAKRVRQLFDAAKLRAPCVIFIDEIDTVGAKRTSSQIHPYANQTINQLLSEMDGFQQNEGVIVLGATNRRDNLDKALLRPGRFDVEVRVYAPDLKGRKDIIKLYLKKVKIGPDIDVDQLARGTTGFTGADLENMVNQAALKAAIEGALHVTMEHMEFAKDKGLMGPAKKSRIPDEATNLMTAYHEAGHTLVAFYTKEATPPHKVTIVPRGMSLGHTSFVPEKEEFNQNRGQLLAQMDVAMGGRVAEELIFGMDKVTTGASSDFTTATSIATAMVKNFGMSEKVGVRVFDNEAFDSGLSMLKVNEVSPATTELVDLEIKRLLQESYDRAKAILKSHAGEHRALAQALMKHETLDADEIKGILEGKKIPFKQRL